MWARRRCGIAQAGWRAQWRAGLPVPVTGKSSPELLAHSRELLDGVHGGALKSAEPHLLGGNVQDTSFSFCDEGAWDRR